MIYVRDDLPVTRQQAEDGDILSQWSGLLSGYGITATSIRNRQELLAKQMGDTIPLRGAVVAEMHDRVVVLSDPLKRAELYSLMAMCMRQNGEDDSPMKAEVDRCMALAMSQVGTKQKRQSAGCATMVLLAVAALLPLAVSFI